MTSETVARLQVLIRELDHNVSARTASLHASGATARCNGVAVEHAPHLVGSWNWQRWVEGWIGEEMPTRRHISAGGCNMSPAEEVFGRIDWLQQHGVPAPIIDQAAPIFAAGYRPDVLVGGSA